MSAAAANTVSLNRVRFLKGCECLSFPSASMAGKDLELNDNLDWLNLRKCCTRSLVLG